MMTTRFPIVPGLIALATTLEELQIDLSTAWYPRWQNEEADALSNGQSHDIAPRTK